MKNQEDASKSIGLQENNYIFQIWKQLKKSIFNVLFVLLDQSENQEKQSLSGLAIENGVDYIQMMAFPFNLVIISVWNGGQTLDTFSNLASNLNVSQMLPGVGFSSFLIMLYSLIFLIILVILDIIYVSYSFTKKKFKYTWPLIFLASVVPLCVTVFSQPILETLLSVVNCQASEIDPTTQIMQNYPDIVCWRSWHMFHAVVTLFFTMIFVFISGIVALTIFEPRMTTNRLSARQNSTGQVVFIVNKMFCQFFFSFTPFSNTWFYTIMLFVLSGWLYVTYNFYDPYYNKSASKFFRIISTYYFWTNFMLMVSQLLLQFDFQGCLVIWLCGLPFIGISIVFQKKSNINKLFSSNLKFRSGEQLQDHLQYVLQLIQNRQKDNNSHMLLIGYIEKHIQICLQEDCPLKMKQMKKEEELTDIEESCKKLIKQLQRMYIQGIKKYPECTRLHLSFAFFHMQRLHNNSKAYEEFTIAESTDPSFGQQFIIYRFKKIIRQNLEQSDQDTDLIEIIRFDNYVSLCQQAMLFSARLHKDFWTLLEQQIPDLQILNSLGSRITETSQSIKQNFHEIQKINQHVPQIIHNYGMYLIFVGQQVSQGKKHLSEAEGIYLQKKSKVENDVKIFALQNQKYAKDCKEIDNCNNAAIKISANLETLGKISFINDGFTEMTGYLKQDITERCIDKILPQIFEKYHLEAIKTWLNCQDKLYMNKNNKYLSQPHKGFIRQKSGFIIPIVYRISYNVDENCFKAVMRADPCSFSDFNFRIYIFTNPTGFIKQISHLGQAYFHLSKEEISNSQYNIEQLGIQVPLTLNKEQHAQKAQVQIKLRSLKKDQIVKAHNMQNFKRKTTKNLLQLQENESNNYDRPQDDFILKIEDVWILSNEDQTQAFNDRLQYADGRIKLGYIYHLQRVQNQLYIKQENVKQSQLNIFQQTFQNMFYDEEEDIFNEMSKQDAQKQKKVKILAEMLNQMSKNGQGQQMFAKHFRNYGRQLKIKTWRYHNEQMKRLYEVQYEDSQSDEFMNQNQDICRKYEMEKFSQQHYKHKLLTAINTHIEYFQITFLRNYSFLFLAGVFTISIWGLIQITSHYSDILSFNTKSLQRSQTTDFLVNALQMAADSQVNNWNSSQNLLIYNQISNFQIAFDPSYQVQCLLQNGQFILKDLQDVLILIYSRILNFFNPQSLNGSLQTTYINFYAYVYTVLESFRFSFDLGYSVYYILLALSILNAVLMMLVWIYNVLKMNQKRFDIMIWFLDIPTDYVVYLENNCNKFLKSYITIKQLEVKGLNQGQDYYVDEYIPKENDGYEDLDQGNKARKILIARHLKKTLLSHFDYSYLKIVWIMFYSLLVVILLYVFISHTSSTFSFVKFQWQLVQKEHLWSAVMPLTIVLNQAGYTSFNNVSLKLVKDTIQSNFLNTLTKQNDVGSINQLIDFDSGVSEIYSQVYYQDICKILSQNGILKQVINSSLSCENILQGRLKGGFSAYSIFLANSDTANVKQTQQAQFNYVSPALMLIFKTWQSYISSMISSYKLFSQLLVYSYLMLSLIVYFAFWIMHLRQQNVKMNQTVQMLNMIPIQMMPKQRKSTRIFLNWIINQASKVRHQEQD